MTHYPLMFTFRDAISGAGYLAGVTLSGRALMAREGADEWWIYGVRPAALAESGKTFEEAYLRYRNRYKAVLFDIASEASTFDAFRAEVERFFYEADELEERNWTAALYALRSGQVTPEGPLAELPREPAESRPTQVTVERLEATSRFTPSDNVPDTFVIPAAA